MQPTLLTVVKASAVIFISIAGTELSPAWALAAGKVPGDVTVTVEGGHLIIRGDDGDNNIIVTEGMVAGRAGTTVNGKPNEMVFDVTGDINIRMNGGDDFVRVELPGFTLVPNNLWISMGSGDDILELLQVVVAGATRILTRAGHDVVFIDGVFRVNTFISSDFGGGFEVETGGGQDLVEINHAIFRDQVNVKLGSGNDNLCATFAAEFLEPGQATFNGGTGFDGFLDQAIGTANFPLAFANFEKNPDDCSFLGGRP